VANLTCTAYDVADDGWLCGLLVAHIIGLGSLLFIINCELFPPNTRSIKLTRSTPSRCPGPQDLPRAGRRRWHEPQLSDIVAVRPHVHIWTFAYCGFPKPSARLLQPYRPSSGRRTIWSSRLKRRLWRAPTTVRSRPWVAFFFGQVTVSGEQLPPSPHPGHGRNLRVLH